MASTEQRDKGQWRDLTAYWMLGLCNNYGYVIMLSAAHDIIGQFQSETAKKGARQTERDCHFLSTGAILLADIIPSTSIKMVIPFLPFWINIRMAVAITLATLGFICVAMANSEAMAILGVVLTSFSAGIGETSLLGHTASYHKNVISTWSSGTGGAGVIGSTSYAALRSFNISPRNTILIMLVFPLMEAASFWILLRNPSDVPEWSLQTDELIGDDDELEGLKAKLTYITELFHYMVPLVLVYFFEYLINQGLFELVYFRNIFIDHAAQYRWLQVDYQIGVFISRSSVNLVHFKRIWIMAVLQGLNVIYFLVEAIYYVTPSIWIVFAMVFWEGLLGGGGYVNTFYRMSREIPPARRRFAIAIVAFADSFGISVSGFLAMPMHNAICKLPVKQRG